MADVAEARVTLKGAPYQMSNFSHFTFGIFCEMVFSLSRRHPATEVHFVLLHFVRMSFTYRTKSGGIYGTLSKLKKVLSK